MLYEIPVKPGDTVYAIDYIRENLVSLTVQKIEITEYNICIIFLENYPYATLEEFGIWFFTKEKDAKKEFKRYLKKEK